MSKIMDRYAIAVSLSADPLKGATAVMLVKIALALKHTQTFNMKRVQWIHTDISPVGPDTRNDYAPSEPVWYPKEALDDKR
jgi:hypothetical protein